ncbi:MBL fold metallo-hydrolase [Halobacillus litoralis]|uniref:MBL fold metallo-hydrolase n=1 Tax=Halobacillus litoralis TaxID=45668 RepID=A0A410MCK6_9BACI|nr:MBL fold metallo-hydrolase [Halobacillus litoralis]QAS52408.1 MBL fold metallo-hydrolase [Halobacillus litoralis]
MIEVKALASSSKGNCYHITDGKTPLLLEAGIKFKEIQRKLDFQTSKIKACLITHEHKDHCAGVPDMIKNGKNCYMSKGTAEAIGVEGHRVKPIKSKEPFTVGTWTILPFEVEHDVAEPLGFLLANEDGDKLLFATDTYYIRYKFKGLTHILCECNYSLDILNKNIAAGRIPKVMKKRLLRSHFSLENVKEFLKANDLQKVREIWLLHLSDNNSDERRFKDEIQALTGKAVYVP